MRWKYYFFAFLMGSGYAIHSHIINKKYRGLLVIAQWKV